MAKDIIRVKGFLAKARTNATGSVYKGRFTCNEIQWTGEGNEALLTFTLTAQELADAIENRLLWTDQDVQRGIRPGLETPPPRTLPLADGYPDPRLYIFNAKNADDMVEKLLGGELLFLSPIIWNLRPGTFEGYWNSELREVYIYSGKIFLPDSHHRQQAILKAVRIWREAPVSYPKFSPNKQFTVELYFLSKEDEGNYFFDKNQRPKPTAMSKAFDLTTLDDLSLLAKAVISKSSALKDNVNRVTDRLTGRNPQVITLSTLREMMAAYAPHDAIDEAEMDGLATVGATFYDLLSQTRSELAVLSISERRRVRVTLIVDSAVMMHGYAALINEFNDSIAKEGLKGAISEWKKKLERFSPDHKYKFGKWSGDLFEKTNPLWQNIGVVTQGRDGKRLTISNTRSTRSECGRVLKQLISLTPPTKDLGFLAKR